MGEEVPECSAGADETSVGQDAWSTEDAEHSEAAAGADEEKAEQKKKAARDEAAEEEPGDDEAAEEEEAEEAAHEEEAAEAAEEEAAHEKEEAAHDAEEDEEPSEDKAQQTAVKPSEDDEHQSERVKAFLSSCARVVSMLDQRVTNVETTFRLAREARELRSHAEASCQQTETEEAEAVVEKAPLNAKQRKALRKKEKCRANKAKCEPFIF